MASVAPTNAAPSTPSCHVNSVRWFVESCAPSGTAGTASSSASTVLQSDFTRTFQIGEEHRFGFLAERRVFDHGVELEVDRDAERVEVGRADAHPAAVHHAGLGVHHLALPFPDANAVREQAAVVTAREERHP